MEIEDRRLQSQGTKASVNDGLSLVLTFALRPSTHRKRGSGTRTNSEFDLKKSVTVLSFYCRFIF